MVAVGSLMLIRDITSSVAAGWTPVTGDWNGDKKDEIGVYQNGNWYLDYNGNGFWDTGDKNYGFGAIGWTPVVGKW